MIRMLTWFVNRSPRRLSTSVEVREIAWTPRTMAISRATRLQRREQDGVAVVRAWTTVSMMSLATQSVARGVAARATRRITIAAQSGRLVRQIRVMKGGTYRSPDALARSVG